MPGSVALANSRLPVPVQLHPKAYRPSAASSEGVAPVKLRASWDRHSMMAERRSTALSWQSPWRCSALLTLRSSRSTCAAPMAELCHTHRPASRQHQMEADCGCWSGGGGGDDGGEGSTLPAKELTLGPGRRMCLQPCNTSWRRQVGRAQGRLGGLPRSCTAHLIGWSKSKKPGSSAAKEGLKALALEEP